MKKSLVISLMTAGALSLSVLGCGKNAAQEDSSIFEDAEDAEDAVTNENSATNEGEADEINASAPINIVNHKVTCEADGKVLAEGNYPEIIISDEIATITVPNKSWSSYTEDGRGMDDGEHVTISKISEEKTDWLDTEVWADKNGFEVASFPYSDDKYLYEVYNPLEYEYNLLDRFTGQRMDKIKVNSGPDQFEVSGDTLYVATYNTAYEFKIE